VRAGIPQEVRGLSIDRCVVLTGLESVFWGSGVNLSDAEIVVAGGLECESDAYRLKGARWGQRVGRRGTGWNDSGCLWDMFHGYMGVTAENVAAKYGSRGKTGRVRFQSRQKGEAASVRAVGEIVPVKIPQRKRGSHSGSNTDEHPVLAGLEAGGN